MTGMRSHIDHPSRLDWWGSAPGSATGRLCGYEPGVAARSQEYGPPPRAYVEMLGRLHAAARRGADLVRPRGHSRLGCAGAAGAGSGLINALASL